MQSQLNIRVRFCFIFYSIAVAPTTMQVLGENWQPLANETVIGPLSDGQLFVSYCEARGGRPKPNVKWFFDGKPLAGEFK